MRASVASLLILAFFAGIAHCGEPSRVTNSAVLKTTLSVLNLIDPAADAKRNAAHGDLRLIGITDYSCHPPGREGAGLSELVETHGIRCLEGTTDAFESAEYGELFHQARGYGIKYNRALVVIIRQLERPVGSSNLSPRGPA